MDQEKDTEQEIEQERDAEDEPLTENEQPAKDEQDKTDEPQTKKSKKKPLSKKKRIIKRVLTVFLCVVLTLVLVVGGYVAYVFIDYDRIEDNLPLTPEGSAKRSAVSTNTTYTVITQNLGFGAYTQDFTFFMDGGTESRAKSKESVEACIAAGAQKAASFDPDFIFFQEVDFGSTRSHQTNQRKQLAELFPDYANVFAVNYHSAYLMYPIFEPHGASNSGIMTFSKATVTDAIRRSLPISNGVSKLLDLDRCYSISRVNVEGGKQLVLFNVHLSAYGGSDAIRTAQMSKLFGDMLAEYQKGNYCVCGGDFNHDFTGTSVATLNDEAHQKDMGWTQPFPVELLPEGLSRAINYTCGEQRPTCRDCDIPYVKGNFTVILDGFLVSDNVTVEYLENVQTDFVYSDHNPVVMKFSLQ